MSLSPSVLEHVSLRRGTTKDMGRRALERDCLCSAQQFAVLYPSRFFLAFSYESDYLPTKNVNDNLEGGSCKVFKLTSSVGISLPELNTTDCRSRWLSPQRWDVTASAILGCKSSAVVNVSRGAKFHCWQEVPWSCLGYMVTKTDAPSFGTRIDSGYEPLAGQLASGC